jgi:hypothetical protein
MTAPELPSYLHSYCEGLNHLGWRIFHSKMIVPMEIIEDERDLIYLLKWILREDSPDFTYEVYTHEMMGAEGRSYIQEQFLESLHEIYEERFLEEFAPEDYFNSWPEDKASRG